MVMNSEWPPRLFRGPESKAHPYPLEIGFRAQVFTTGSIFYSAYTDEVMSQYLKNTKKPYDKIRDQFVTQYGMSEQNWEINWKAFESYITTFGNPTIQNALFGMVMHWDWYIAKLGAFIEFARQRVSSPFLTKKQRENLERIGRKSIRSQISILSYSTGIDFDKELTRIANLVEMDSVRNLGMHNQWVVSELYKSGALNPNDWQIGTMRTVAMNELEVWRQTLSDTIIDTSTMIGQKYIGAPDYTGA